MDFRRYLDKTARELEKEVEKILEGQLKEAGRIDKKLMSLLTAFAKVCRGGKGIRGALVMLGYEIGKGTGHRVQGTEKGILKIAAAYEIFHTAILIHDDIIDQSPIRRDQPALHQALGGNQYGMSQAISLADYGFFLSFKLISESNFLQERKVSALKLFSQAMMNTVWGELLDLEETDPILVMKLKTACYTIAGPLQMGAVLAGADGKIVRIFGEFGEKLGIAYQIRDDILDSEVDNIKGLDSAEKAVEKYTMQVLKILPDITKDQKMNTLLKQMVEYLVKRAK